MNTNLDSKRNIFYVAVGALVLRDGKLLLGKRKNIYSAGDWGLPGGHLELNENMGKAIERELLEETGMTAESFVFSSISNKPMEDRHYIFVGFIANNPQGEPKNMEPDKCFGWEWFPLNALPNNIIFSSATLIDAYVKKINFIDS